MVYKLVVNAVKQVLQLQSLQKLSDKDFSELINVLSFLQEVQLSKKDAQVINQIAYQAGEELKQRSSACVVIVLCSIDSELERIIREMPMEERLKMLDFVIQLKEQQSGRKFSKQEHDELRDFLVSL